MKIKSNSISILRPDLVRYFSNPEDAKVTSLGNGNKFLLVCPDCGAEKYMVANKLVSRGFSCNICSDGISVPEKFCRAILNQIGVYYETEKIFKWAKDKKYDFYIPSLNMIIETHGEQHYVESRRKKRSLVEEIENDLLKYNLAMENENCKSYISIECRNSNYEYLKVQFINSLSGYLDLSLVIWEDVFLFCTNSIVMDVIFAWNNKNKQITEIAKEFKVNRNTVSRYLKIGSTVGLCDYDSKISKDNSIDKMKKEVIQLGKNGEFINKFESLSEASKQTNINKQNISKCCLGKNNVKYAGGFIWKYK